MTRQVLGPIAQFVVSSSLVVAFVVGVVPGSSATSEPEPPCSEVDEFAGRLTGTVEPIAPAGFEVGEPLALLYKDDGFEFLFGRRRFANWDQATLEIDIPDGETKPPRDMELFVRVNRPEITGTVAEDRFIGRSNIVAFGRVARDQQSIDILVCVDTLDPEPAPAGNYVGSIAVEHDGFTSAAVPLEVNLQNPDMMWPLAFVLAAAIGASGFQWLISRTNQSLTNAPSFQVKGRTVSLELLIGVGAGVIAAIGTVFIRNVLLNPSWSGEFQDLWGVAVSAAIAAGAAYPAAAAVTRGTAQKVGDGKNRNERNE